MFVNYRDNHEATSYSRRYGRTKKQAHYKKTMAQEHGYERIGATGYMRPSL
jgi:hypothetical protein